MNIYSLFCYKSTHATIFCTNINKEKHLSLQLHLSQLIDDINITTVISTTPIAIPQLHLTQLIDDINITTVISKTPITIPQLHVISTANITAYQL